MCYETPADMWQQRDAGPCKEVADLADKELMADGYADPTDAPADIRNDYLQAAYSKVHGDPRITREDRSE